MGNLNHKINAINVRHDVIYKVSDITLLGAYAQNNFDHADLTFDLVKREVSSM